MAHSSLEAIASQLHSVAIHLLRRLREADGQSGLSSARLSALSVLVFGGPSTLGELAAAEQVTAPTMSRLARELEESGLVSRSRTGMDRRTITLRATKRGHQVLQRSRALRVARFTEFLTSATPAELRTLSSAATILERLVSAPPAAH